MYKRFVNPPCFASWRPVFLIILIWQLGVSVHAQAQDQSGWEAKNILIVNSAEVNTPVFVQMDRGLSPTLQLTHWDFRYYLIGGLFLFLVQALLLFRLLLQKRRRRVTEEALRETEGRYRTLFSRAGDGIFIMSLAGELIDVNESFARMHGYSTEEMRHKKLKELDTPETFKMFSERMRRILDGEMLIFEVEHYHKDGHVFPLEVSAGLISFKGQTYVQCFHRDISERRQAQEALGERLRFEQLLLGLSARFVNIPLDRVDSEIEDGLRKVLAFFQVDRCGLLQILPSKASWQIIHIASSDDVPPLPAGVELSSSLYPWVYEKLTKNHEVISVSRLDDLPADANADRQTCIKWGIRSFVNIPVLNGEYVDHVININAVKSERAWPEELFPRLRLLGEIFVNALQRKQVGEAFRESERVLRQNESDLRKLAGRLINAHEEDRTHLARELHDDLSQRLAVFAIDVGQIERQLKDSPAPVREALSEMKNSIISISQDVHDLARRLHPSILDDLGLIKAVESECAGFLRREGIEIVFNHENIPKVIPKDISLSLYRIIQEGLSNISKHACAEHISVSLRGIDHGVLLSVQDDGIGFDAAEVKAKPGLGFSSMRERARLIGGEFSVRSRLEQGTVLTVQAPLPGEGE